MAGYVRSALTVDAFRAGRDISTLLLAFTCAITALVAASGEMLVVAMTLFVALLIVRSRVSPAPEAARA